MDFTSTFVVILVFFVFVSVLSYVLTRVLHNEDRIITLQNDNQLILGTLDYLLVLTKANGSLGKRLAERLDTVEARELESTLSLIDPEKMRLQHLRPMYDSQGLLFDVMEGYETGGTSERERTDTTGDTPTEAETDSTSGTVCCGDVS